MIIYKWENVLCVWQETMENVKKCKNFLSTLIKLASTGKQSTETAASVRELVKDLLVSELYTLTVTWTCQMPRCFSTSLWQLYMNLFQNALTSLTPHFVFWTRRANWKLRNSPADCTKSSILPPNLTLCLSSRWENVCCCHCQWCAVQRTVSVELVVYSS